MGRLTRATSGAAALGQGTSSWTQTYSYDIFGNRTSVAASGQSAGVQIPTDGRANVTYNTLTNRITTAGFEYDANGNQTRALAPDGQTYYRYEYDDANRLIYIKQDNGTLIQTQEFGIGNNRISVTDAASNLKTYYQGSAVEYTELNNSGVLAWTKSYVYLGDSLLSTTTASGVEYAHPDALGTRLVSNAQTGATSENVNLPFGTQIANESTNTTNKRKFTSYDRSTVTGLDYAQNRTYDSKQGRFTQVDPIGISASSLMNPQSLNLYAYCGNDPINHTDPTGLFWGALKRFFGKVLKIVKIVVAVVVALAGVLAISLGHPEIGIPLLVGSANIFAQVSGNKTFQTITKYLSIAISAYQIYNSPPSIIVSFYPGSSGTNSHFSPILFAGVGAIINSFASRRDDKDDVPYSPIAPLRTEFYRRLASGNCEQKLNDLFNALGRKGKQSFSRELAEKFFQGTDGKKLVSGTLKNKTSGVSAEYGDDTIRIKPRNFGIDPHKIEADAGNFIHELIHAGRGGEFGFRHEDILKAIDQTEGTKPGTYTDDSWLKKYCPVK